MAQRPVIAERCCWGTWRNSQKSGDVAIWRILSIDALTAFRRLFCRATLLLRRGARFALISSGSGNASGETVNSYFSQIPRPPWRSDSVLDVGQPRACCNGGSTALWSATTRWGHEDDQSSHESGMVACGCERDSIREPTGNRRQVCLLRLSAPDSCDRGLDLPRMQRVHRMAMCGCAPHAERQRAAVHYCRNRLFDLVERWCYTCLSLGRRRNRAELDSSVSVTSTCAFFCHTDSRGGHAYCLPISLVHVELNEVQHG